MKSKITAGLGISLLALAMVTKALAGGWATITLEQLPAGTAVGDPLSIRFVVRQHGKTLMEGLAPTVSAQNTTGGETLSIEAFPVAGKAGHYEAVLAFPAAGTWEWTILAFTMNQRMPDLVVTASASESPTPSGEASRGSLFAAVTGLAIALAALLLSLYGKQKWAISLVLLGLLFGGAGLAAAASAEKQAEPAPSMAQASSPIETGRALFVAKGCVSCHVNSKVEQKYFQYRSEFGPNLSAYLAGPALLKTWLKDPQSVRPKTEMPNLELSETEIDALVAFLSAAD